MAQANRVVEILKPGEYPNLAGKMVELSEAHLEEIAVGYNADHYRAPLVVGHPKDDSPQYGAVVDLKVRNGILLAELENVHPDLITAVRAGRYSTLSASLYGPDSPTNPKPGGYSLRHVGVLGGAAPVVKGLKRIEFAEGGEGSVTAALDFPETGFQPGGLERKQPTARRYPAAPEEDHAARELSLAEREAALDRANTERVKAIEERERKVRRSEGLQFAESMANAGQIAPSAVEPLAEVLATLDAAAPIEFSEAGGKVEKKISGGDWLREFVKNGPAAVPYGESKNGGSFPTNVNLGEKGDMMPTDPRRAALHRDALQLAEKEDISYIDAVRKLGG